MLELLQKRSKNFQRKNFVSKLNTISFNDNRFFYSKFGNLYDCNIHLCDTASEYHIFTSHGAFTIKAFKIKLASYIHAYLWNI